MVVAARLPTSTTMIWAGLCVGFATVLDQAVAVSIPGITGDDAFAGLTHRGTVGAIASNAATSAVENVIRGVDFTSSRDGPIAVDITRVTRCNRAFAIGTTGRPIRHGTFISTGTTVVGAGVEVDFASICWISVAVPPSTITRADGA